MTTTTSPTEGAAITVGTSETDRDREIVAGYSSGQNSHYEVMKLLGFDNRWDTENWLGDHGANWNYSLQDLEADRQTFARLRRDGVIK